MQITLQRFRPSVRELAVLPIVGSISICLVASLLGDLESPIYVGLSLLIALIDPIMNLFSYFGLKYFHLTARIMSETRRKRVTDLVRFLVGMSSQYSLIYAEFVGDHEAVSYVGGYFAKNFPEFQVRITVTDPTSERSMLRLFSDREMSREMAITKDVEVVPGATVGIVLERMTAAYKEKREKNEHNEEMN